MLNKIKEFQKAAKAAGRDTNSMEEFKTYLEAENTTTSISGDDRLDYIRDDETIADNIILQIEALIEEAGGEIVERQGTIEDFLWFLDGELEVSFGVNPNNNYIGIALGDGYRAIKSQDIASDIVNVITQSDDMEQFDMNWDSDESTKFDPVKLKEELAPMLALISQDPETTDLD